MAESTSCTLCGKSANLEHVLSACQSILADGKIWWCHNKILSQVVDGVEQVRRRVKQLSDRHNFIHFVRTGESTAAGQRSRGVLASGNEWEMWADPKKQLKFPNEIGHTILRPDIVLWSKRAKQVVLIG